MKKTVCALLCAALAVTLACPAFAAEQPAEVNEAGAYLRERGVYRGDSTGSLMLDKGLTRAEMAAVITRLHGEGEVNPEHYTWACYFTDVPAWAKPYVSAALLKGLVQGSYSSDGEVVFLAHDPITAAEAAVLLDRALRITSVAETITGEPSWYSQAVANLNSCDALPASAMLDEPLTRAQAAVMLYNLMARSERGV